jgi:hypothetical protein
VFFLTSKIISDERLHQFQNQFQNLKKQNKQTNKPSFTGNDLNITSIQSEVALQGSRGQVTGKVSNIEGQNII